MVDCRNRCQNPVGYQTHPYQQNLAETQSSQTLAADHSQSPVDYHYTLADYSQTLAADHSQSPADYCQIQVDHLAVRQSWLALQIAAAAAVRQSWVVRQSSPDYYNWPVHQSSSDCYSWVDY